jgi:hypothetical protein
MEEVLTKEEKRVKCRECIHLDSCPFRELDGPVADCVALLKESRLYGLCATCSLKEACLKRHVEGGVWKCKDYSEPD